jgi:solute carrier family 35 (UDP-galactose transporter), member B1
LFKWFVCLFVCVVFFVLLRLCHPHETDNIQLGKTILAGVGLLVLNELHIFLQLVQEMGFVLVLLGLTGALGQVFIFVTIAKFGALTCSIIGLARKVTTLVASIYFYGHTLNSVQFIGLLISIGSMVMDFCGKKGGSHGHGSQPGSVHKNTVPEEMERMLQDEEDDYDNAVMTEKATGSAIEMTNCIKL